MKTDILIIILCLTVGLLIGFLFGIMYKNAQENHDIRKTIKVSESERDSLQKELNEQELDPCGRVQELNQAEPDIDDQY